MERSLIEDVDISETKEDYIVLGLTILMVIIGLAFIIWSPDVEAIGTWIYERLSN